MYTEPTGSLSPIEAPPHPAVILEDVQAGLERFDLASMEVAAMTIVSDGIRRSVVSRLHDRRRYLEAYRGLEEGHLSSLSVADINEQYFLTTNNFTAEGFRQFQRGNHTVYIVE